MRARWAAALGVGAAAAAFGLAPDAPGLADLIGFAARARALPASGWADPNHPAGYPLLLRVGALALGDVVQAANALNALAFGAVVGLGARAGGLAGAALLGAGAAAALPVAGTDLPAAAAGLAAVHAAAGRRPGAAGLWWGLSLGMRYQSALLAPVLLWLSGRRAPRVALGAALLWAPLALGAAMEGAWPGPDPRWNLALAHGGEAPGPAAVWAGFGRALADLGGLRTDGAAGLAVAVAVGLAAAVRGRAPRARALGAWALLHLALLAFFFSNARLVLPARLALLGAAAGAGPLGRGLAVFGALTAVPATGAPATAALDAVAAALPPGPVWASDPRVHGRDGPWLRPARPWSALDPAARRGPGSLLWAAAAAGAAVVLDGPRVRGQYPAFTGLLEGPAPAGWADRPAPAGWRVLVPTGAAARAAGGALRGGEAPLPQAESRSLP